MNGSPQPDPRVARDLARGLYRQGVMASLISAIVGAVIVAVMWKWVAHGVLAGWYALVLVNQVARILLLRAFRRVQEGEFDAARWLRRYSWTMATGGAIFGSVPLLMFAGAGPLAQAFLIVMVFGLASGALSANAYHRPTLVLHMMLMLLPMIITLALAGGVEYGALAFTSAFGLLMTLAFGLRQSAIIRESMELRHRNVDLIAELEARTALAEAEQRRAEQASLAKSQFFAAASHDLRQPLQALGLYAASFGDAKRDPGDARNIEQILASVDALESLFDELLDISKLDAGYVKPELSHFRASRIFQRLEATFAPVARKQGLGLGFRGGDAVLRSDPVLLERLLGNLVSNALRYTEAGNVLVSVEQEGSTARIGVADTGIGIPREYHERIFDEFYQLGNPERDRKRGLGLGLATVRRLGQLLEHGVTLASEPGKGTVFRVGVETGDAALATNVAAPPEAADMNALAGLRVAVVEDDASVREGLAKLLAGWRCETVAAASVAEAIALLADAPEAIIADYRLGENETGIAAIEALRRRFGAAIPAILMTGDTSPEIFAAALQHRLPVLTKPVRAARLRAAMTSLSGPLREPRAA